MDPTYWYPIVLPTKLTENKFTRYFQQIHLKEMRKLLNRNSSSTKMTANQDGFIDIAQIYGRHNY